MKKIVIMPGGFHPFHAGHASLYNAAVQAFPDADVYVAATNDTSNRPFPFAIKEKLAKLAGVAPRHFIQVKNPFQAKEITSKYNPEQDVLIFVRSDKDKESQPKPGGVKKDGSPSYLQPYSAENLEPFGKHAYMAYLPTVEFGPGMTSATEIRTAWPTLNEKRKLALVMSLYPKTQGNVKLAQTVVKLLDAGIGGLGETVNPQLGVGGLWTAYQGRENQPISEQPQGAVEAYGYAYNNRDQRVVWRKIFPSAEAAHAWADKKNATVLDVKPAPQTANEDYVEERRL